MFTFAGNGLGVRWASSSLGSDEEGETCFGEVELLVSQATLSNIAEVKHWQ